MSEKQFLKKNRVELIEATGNTTVYKKINYPFGGEPKIKFFYFRNGSLVQVDEGVRNPDIIIQHR